MGNFPFGGAEINALVSQFFSEALKEMRRFNIENVKSQAANQ